MIIAAKDVPCPVCQAEPGDECTYRYHAGGKRNRTFKYGVHSRRCSDADDAMRAMHALLGVT